MAHHLYHYPHSTSFISPLFLSHHSPAWLFSYFLWVGRWLSASSFSLWLPPTQSPESLRIFGYPSGFLLPIYPNHSASSAPSPPASSYPLPESLRIFGSLPSGFLLPFTRIPISSAPSHFFGSDSALGSPPPVSSHHFTQITPHFFGSDSALGSPTT
ncbi:hypothetical protein B0H14DRAFT_3466851 [Mycena olivaceomarginata]|nr:hypothetical protein B0H14DRAFT_3466851 [Mycena olivaceomarginata]